MPQSVRITDEDYRILKAIKNKEKRTFIILLSKAIQNLAIAKRITAWDKLSKSHQEELKQKVKKLR